MGKGEDNKPAEPEANVEKKPEPSVLATPKVEETTAKVPVDIKPVDTKKDADSIRKVIKLGSTEERPKEDDKKKDNKPSDLSNIVQPDDATKATPGSSDASTRETLEQRRAILQSIKDFDFQIKKSQEDINNINTKLESLSKDLDDLVSLYEIVSEQMNPFVGISKVTKKRLDALENFIKEIDSLKNRVGDLESFAERTGIKIEDFKGVAKGEQTMPQNNMVEKLSDEDLDKIIERSLGELTSEESVDMLINEFVESLKNGNVDR